MLSKGFRDEEKERASEALTDLIDIEFVPDLWKKEQEEKVEDFIKKFTSLDLQQVLEIPADELLLKLKESNFGSQQYEEFGDLLIKMIPVYKEKEQELAQKALALYEFSQIESRTFSFGLIQKVNDAKALS